MSNNSSEINPGDNCLPGLADSFSEADVALVALESANVGIWIMDAGSGKFLPSKKAKMLFGYHSEEEVTFEQAIQAVAEKHQHIVLKAVEKAIVGRASLYVECPVNSEDQQQRWLSITGGFSQAIKGDNYFSGIVIDITEQKHNEMRRSKFIGMVSHDLKTPLTALKAYVQLLSNWARKQKDHFTMGALSKVEKQVKKMLSMINGLLSLSGAEAGKIHLTKQQFSLETLIDEVIEDTLFLISTHEIIRLPSESIVVNADKDKIEQVLVNLLSNAAKYSSEDSPIEIQCRITSGMVEVAVEDQGMGITAADAKKLFQPHYRVERAETDKIAGFGIGLYLCAEIIKRHDGKVWVESEPGKGSTFKFTLPL